LSLPYSKLLNANQQNGFEFLLRSAMRFLTHCLQVVDATKKKILAIHLA